MSNHRLVYSTDSGRICPRCGRPQAACSCPKHSPESRPTPVPRDGVVRIRRETQGRKGKTVSVVHGLPETGLTELARDLKQRCGAGGSVKHGTLVIQGDHRLQLQAALEKLGYTVKQAGG